MTAWGVRDSAGLLEGTAFRLAGVLRAACIELVETSHLERKLALGTTVHSTAILLTRCSNRLSDLRAGLSPHRLTAEGGTSLDAAAGSLVRFLADALPVAGRRLRLADAETWKLVEDVATGLAVGRERLGRLGGPGAVPGPAAGWRPPRRPGRPESIEVVDDAPAGTGLDDPAPFLHGAMFTIELCAAELCAASIALHLQEAPVPLIADLAKQVADELRHFLMLEGLLTRSGSAVGDFPVDTLIWDKFLLGGTLPERLMIEQRLGEGTGLDGGYALLRHFQERDDRDAAQVFDFINADEMTHVRNGNRWLLALCGTPEAVLDLEAGMRSRLAHKGWPVVPLDPVNEGDRLLAGFSPAEVEECRRRARAYRAMVARA